jgi:sporulation protein YlmC with PRC-barrel domain
MISKTIAAALLSTALFTGVATAQTAAPKADNANATATMHHEGEWRASKLVGVNVYNEANEKIGDINEVILDKSGKASNVILGVGGFLGMGEHLVAVPFEKLKFVNEPVRSASTSTSTSTTTPANAPATNVDSNARTASDGAARTTGTAATTPATTRSAGPNWYPDHAVYNATKDQLKAMPQFKF